MLSNQINPQRANHRLLRKRHELAAPLLFNPSISTKCFGSNIHDLRTIPLANKSPPYPEPSKIKENQIQKELAHLHSHWPNNAQSSGFLFPNRGTYPQNLELSTQSTIKHSQMSLQVHIATTNKHTFATTRFQIPANSTSISKNRGASTQKPQNPKTNTLNLRRHTETPSTESMRGS
jgi:hypothetical protein